MIVPYLPTTRRTTGAIRMTLLGVLVIFFGTVATGHGDDRLDLSGEWRFELDEHDSGVEDAWFKRRLSGRITLPGSLQEQGFGNDPSLDTQWTGDIVDRSFFESPRYQPYREPDNFKVPFWLQPRKHFLGPAWYQRDVTIPADWLGKRIVLRLERCHWRTTVWVNGQEVGSQNSLSTPHLYDLTTVLVPGPEHRRMHSISIRVDNRIQDINVGSNAHSVTDHTQSNWNGIVGDVQLEVTDLVWIDDVQVYPDLAKRIARVKVKLGNMTRSAGRGSLTLDAQETGTHQPHDPPPLEVPVSFDVGESTVVDLEYPLGEAMQLWDEFQPTHPRRAFISGVRG